MKNLLIYFTIISLWSCEEMEPVNDVTNPTPINLTPRQSNIIDKSPKFSSLNSTTSIAYSNKFFPGFYYTLEKASSAKFQINEINFINADFRFNDASRCFLDYNQDGFLDLFGFLTNFKSKPWGSQNGKFILVDDVLGPNPKVNYIDATWRFGSRMRISDINMDGTLDILLGNEEDHQLEDGSFGKSSPFQIITLNKNMSITANLIGESVSTHTQTFGDIDNDGDIDIITWRNAYTNPNNEDLASYPIAYINNGIGNYSTENSFDRFKNLDKLIPVMGNGNRKNYPITTIELFDVDGDN